MHIRARNPGVGEWLASGRRVVAGVSAVTAEVCWVCEVSEVATVSEVAAVATVSEASAVAAMSWAWVGAVEFFTRA
jgi:hypothetical protein